MERERRTSIVGDPERGRGGFYSPVFLIELETAEERISAVIKQYGKSPDNTDRSDSFYWKVEVDTVMSDVEEVKNALREGGIKVPTTLHTQVVDDTLNYREAAGQLFEEETWVEGTPGRLLLVEDYAGVSIRDYCGEDRQLAIQEARNTILLLPTHLPLDVHPGNLVWNGEEIAVVDFMPPKIWDYRGMGRMEQIFPTISINQWEDAKVREYHTTEGRLERFERYLSKR